MKMIMRLSSISNTNIYLQNSSSFLTYHHSNNNSSSSKLLFSGRSIARGSRNFSMAGVSASYSNNGTQDSGFKGGVSFLRSVLGSMEAVYLNRNPTAKAILELVHSIDNDHIYYDHLAFRTFGVSGHGIDSLAKFFLDFGYSQRDELRYP